MLIERINQRLAELQRSARDVSIAATGQPDTIRNILRGATQKPKADTLEKIASELMTTSAWLLGTSGAISQPLPIEVSPAPVPVPQRSDMPNDVPVHGTAAASHLRGAFQLSDGVIDYVRRPPALRGAGAAYALYVEGTSMEPRYQPGDLVFVHPQRPARLGDTVIVQMQFNPGEVEASIGFLRRRSANHVTIGKLNPAADIQLPAERVSAIHRVLTVNELFGV